MKAIRQLENSLPCDASHRFPSVIVKPFELCVVLAAVSATAAARLTFGIKAFYTKIMDLSIMIFPINPVWRGRFCLVDRARALQGCWPVLSGCPAASKAHASRRIECLYAEGQTGCCGRADRSQNHAQFERFYNHRRESMASITWKAVLK